MKITSLSRMLVLKHILLIFLIVLCESKGRKRDLSEELRKLKETKQERKVEVVMRVPRTVLIDKPRRGPPGEPGLPGPPGETGEPGVKGKTGSSGPDGPSGPKGKKGPPGPRGKKGKQGEDGDAGPKGPNGIPGGCVLDQKDGHCIPGPRGKQGRKGSQGAPGDRGAEGESGEKGTKGRKGQKGDRGPPGTPGLPGMIAGPVCTARYTDWVSTADFISGKQSFMCDDMEFLWNVEAENEARTLRYRYHCCQFRKA